MGDLPLHIGPYPVEEELGRGGMGIVYRARDPRLGRDVAIKVLPRELYGDRERLARFEREARVLASLNHPHIAAIYGLEEAEGERALVLELVEGETLAERLERGPLPVAEAIAVARQITEALEAAHERGIVHRDLKPANVKLTPGGAVKVLDFGLARVVERCAGEGASQLETATAAATEAGVILGTAAYMSPQQARGEAVDERADVWAFGCLLYEILTGRRAFVAGTLSDTLAAVLRADPEWDRLPAATPAAIRRLLRRCLAKDAGQRLRHIGDARLELDEALAAEGATVTDRGGGPRRRALAWALATAALAAAVGLAVWVWSLADSAAAPRGLTRVTVTVPADLRLDTSAGAAPLALSPDGRDLVYVAHGHDGRAGLHLRRLDSFATVPIPGTEGARYPFFAPDGQSVAFFADGELKRVSLQGGSPVTVCAAPVVGRGGTWGTDGTIVFDPGKRGLLRVPASGGAAQPLASGDAEMDARNLSWPHFLPDGRTLLATTYTEEGAVVAALSLASGHWQRLAAGSQAHYVPTGYLLFHAPGVREGELQAVGFDAERLALRSEPVTVLESVFRAENGGGAYFAVSASGTLAFSLGGHARTLVGVDRNGRRRPLLDERRGFRFPSLAPDGRRLAVTIDPRPSQIWVYDLERRSGIPLATEGHSLVPLWTPDGRQLTYSTEGDVVSRPADGSGAARRLLARDGAQYPAAWLGDMRSLLFTDAHPVNRHDLWLLPADGEPRPLLATPAQEMMARLSPDERWLAYVSDESGRFEVYLRPFPDVDASRVTVSTRGGVSPVWAPDGRELFYLDGSAMMAVPLEVEGETLRPGVPELLFTGPFETGSPQFDVSPDGSWFVMVEADPEAKPTQIHLILGWGEELPRLAPARR